MNAGPPDPPPTPEMLARCLAHLSPLEATGRCMRAARRTGGLTVFLEEAMRLIALRSLIEDGSLTPEEAQTRLRDGVVAPEYCPDQPTRLALAVLCRPVPQEVSTL